MGYFDKGQILTQKYLLEFPKNRNFINYARKDKKCFVKTIIQVY